MSGFRPPPPRSLWRPDERDSPTCLYCGEIGCRIRNCKHVEEDMAKGYCHRSPEGRIVAFDGRYLQRVGEQTIRDAILEYAKKNGLIRTPGQPQATDAPDHPPAGMMRYEAVEEPVGYNETRAVNLGERIEELDSKILRLESLRSQSFQSDIVICTTKFYSNGLGTCHRPARARRAFSSCFFHDASDGHRRVVASLSSH